MAFETSTSTSFLKFMGSYQKKHETTKMKNNRFASIDFRGVHDSLVNELKAVLDWRPRIPISSYSNVSTALTPAHLLWRDSLLSLPDGTSDQDSLFSKYKLIQQMYRDFCKSRSRDYSTKPQVRKRSRICKYLLEMMQLFLCTKKNSYKFGSCGSTIFSFLKSWISVQFRKFFL